MATGFRIEIGYNPDGYHDYHWNLLKEAVATVKNEPKAVEKTALRFGCPDSDGEYDLYDFCTIYQSDYREGSPIEIFEAKDGETGRETPFIGISCSGSDPSRAIKEHVARAFCYLVFEQMASRGINISIIVA